MAWAGAEVRRRWQALIVLGVLVGVTAGLAVAAVVGSRQNHEALQRLREATNAHDVTVFASQTDNIEPDWDRLRAMTEVKDLAVWLLLIGEVDGEEYVLFAPGDDRWLDDMNRPIVTSGRMFDPAAPDEMVVAESALGEYPIGTTVHFKALGSDVLTGGDGSNGPDVTFHVVGGVRTINQFTFTEQAFVSPGFVDAYGGDFLRIENADLRLRDPATDVAAVQAAVNEIVFEGTPIFDLNVAARRSETTLGVESNALLILAAVIAIAGGLLVAQAAGRSAASIEEDAPALRGMGMTSADLRLATVLAHTVTLVAAVVAMLATAIGTSGLFPVGLGREIHPEVGIHVAWGWVLPAVVLTAALTMAGIQFAVIRTLRRPTAMAVRAVSRPIALLRRVTSIPVGLGITMAFDSGTGPRRMPARPALVAAIVGVAGVIATLSINNGIEDALAHPGQAGQVSDIVVSPAGFEATGDFDAQWVAEIEEAAGPSAETAQFGRFASSVGGIGTLVLAIQPTGDDITASTELTVTSGRGPERPGEVALGPKTARDMNASIGDTVTLDALDATARVVGIALLPP
jgi:MacB-like periplasmic core domain